MALVILAGLGPTLASTRLKNFFAIAIFIGAIAALAIFKKVNVKAVYIALVIPALCLMPFLINVFQQGDFLGSVLIKTLILIVGTSLYITSIGTISNHVKEEQLKWAFGIILVFNLVIIFANYVSPAIGKLSFKLFYTNSDMQQILTYLKIRPSGTFGNPNTLALSAVFMGIAFISKNNNKSSILFLTLIFIVILVSKSRTGLACFFIMVFAFNALHKKYLTILTFILIPIIVATLLFSFNILNFAEYKYRFVSNFNLAGRDTLWVSIVNNEMVIKNMLFGSLKLPVGILVVDNEYLNVFVRYGVFGLIIYLSCLLGMTVYLFKKSYIF